MPDDSTEPLTASEIEKLRTRVAGSNYPHLDGGRELATIDALTARVTELEAVLFTANEDRDEWRQSAEAWERSAKERLERAATAEHRATELEAELRIAKRFSDIVRSEAADEGNRAAAAESQVADLSAQVEAYRALEVAARECVDAAKDLRKYVSPDSGCGYFTYKRIWDSSMQAETHFVHALTALSDKEEEK